jgi:hypothetical protein
MTLPPAVASLPSRGEKGPHHGDRAWDLRRAGGAHVQVWLTGSGQPEAPPVGVTEAMFSAVVMAIAALCAAAIALLICYWLGRLALDRRRLARWASEWSLTGPRWTARRR